MNQNAVEIRALEKHFPRFKLGPLDLTVPQGVIYGLIGPNGAGKTTTLDLIFGLGDPDAGTIKVLGLDHRRDEVAVKRQAAYASPDASFRTWGTGRKLIRFVSGFYPAWDEAYCEKLLAELHVNPDEKITALSSGGRVKLGVIIALAWHPKVVILDEPAAGLDAISKQQVFAELLAAVQDEERTVIISSHALTDLERFADHIGMIKNGQLLLEGPTCGIVERFKLLDFVSEDGAAFVSADGVFIQRHERDQWQAMVNMERNTMESLASRGARQISATPMTLEDIFVALGKD
jgi:ABC-2 type transport system ATP-binding protein